MKPHVSGNLGRTDMMKPVVGHNLNDQNGLPDGIRVAVSQSLHLSGYLLNHGRRWHAFLINVQVHNAKTASGTTVAIADKAKVYILMLVSATWPQCRHCRSTKDPSFDPQENIALCLGPLNWCLFLTKSGENTIKDSFDSPPSSSSSVFCNFCSGLRPAGSHMVGGNQHIPFLPHSSDSEDAYPSATGFLGIPPEIRYFWECWPGGDLPASWLLTETSRVFPLPFWEFFWGTVHRISTCLIFFFSYVATEFLSTKLDNVKVL